MYVYIYMDVSENSGFSPQIIHFNIVFHYFHHPFWGPTPILGNTHIYLWLYIYTYLQFSPLVLVEFHQVLKVFSPFKTPGQDCRRAHGAAWVPLVPLATKGLDDLFGDRGFQQKRHFFFGGENIYLLGTVKDFYVGKKS